MTDFLLAIGQNPQARKLIKSLGLPIPLPEKLRRARGPWEERPLADMNVVFGAGPEASLANVVAETLTAAGANPYVVGEASALTPFKAPGESYGRPAKLMGKAAGEVAEGAAQLRAGALVFDATGIEDPAGLRGLYEFFHPLMTKLGRSARVVVLGRPPQLGAASPAKAAARTALEGFVRSMAKEVGRSGSTAQVVYVEEGAESRLPAVLRFLLSPRSAFITGQPITVTSRVRTAGASPTPYTRPLDGKVALVTGAARGIGAATAKLLAAEGARVVCLDRPADDGPTSQLAREIGGAVLLADVSDPDAPTMIASELIARFGGVDIVVHNAGITRDKTMARMSPELWDQTLDINLAALVRITDALRAKALHDDGRIICLSSIAGIAGNMGQTNYAASKAGVIGFVRALAADDEVAGRGITVNAIAPGFIETRLTAAIPVTIREAARRMSSLGQGGLPEDVGQAITFLATPGAVGITGSVLRVCGGSLVGA